MRFGGMIMKPWSTPEEWALAAQSLGYTAVYFPVDYKAPINVIDSFKSAAKSANLVICEIGVWNNTLDANAEKREGAILRAIRQLELADYVGANCCVNISGTKSETSWDGPHNDNMTERTFDEIVSTTQRIIDAAKPKNTYYTLEPMPYLYPDSADSYLKLIKAIERKSFGAHIDIVNVINSPEKYYNNGTLIREWFDKLLPYIRSCHAKDIILQDELTVHLSECRPGTGNLDYDEFLRCASRLNDTIAIMLEHMTEESDYTEATKFIKGRAKSLGISL